MTTRIEVELTADDAYERWSHVEDLPRFLSHFDRVQVVDGRRMRVESTVAGVSSQWEAAIVEQSPGAAIAWRAIDGTHNGGRVEFRPRGIDRTEVALYLEIDGEGEVALNDAAQLDLARFRSLVTAVAPSVAASVPTPPRVVTQRASSPAVIGESVHRRLA